MTPRAGAIHAPEQMRHHQITNFHKADAPMHFGSWTELYVQHPRWTALCRLFASVEKEFDFVDSGTLSTFERIVEGARGDWAEVFAASQYINFH